MDSFRFRYWMLVPLGLIVAAVIGLAYGRGPFFLAFALLVLLLAIGLFWSSILSLTGDAPLTLEEALGLAAPSIEEERKAAVLRALKDLEYERTVGKVSDEDYRELSAKYRTEAKLLLQLVEGQLTARRNRVEAALAQRLSELEPTSTQATPSVEPAADAADKHGAKEVAP